jgi:hypothetical protein
VEDAIVRPDTRYLRKWAYAFDSSSIVILNPLAVSSG